MKNLHDCKEFFKDLYFNCLSVDAFSKSIFDCVELSRYEMHCDTLLFVFGDEFKEIKPNWISEASKEYYSKK